MRKKSCQEESKADTVSDWYCTPNTLGASNGREDREFDQRIVERSDKVRERRGLADGRLQPERRG